MRYMLDMSKYRNSKVRSSRISKKGIVYIVVSVVFIMTFIFYLAYNFLTNCIFERPIRWDIGTCWHEQIAPAKNKAAESAAKFIP